MAKTSDWVIVATEGTTVSDKRVISANWINDMAALYDPKEFKALIWPEHYRSAWAVFEGKNWGEVEALKAGLFDDKLRLFAKLTPNRYLLEANKDGQKLFTSIEPEPDYKSEGRCYLLGLAVTDSPASSGTTRLRFSRVEGQSTELECSALEEWDLTNFYSQESTFFQMCKNFFQHYGDSSPQPETNPPQPEEEEPMNQEQFSQVMGAINSIGTKQGELEEKFNQFSKELPATNEGKSTENDEDSDNGVTSAQFSKVTELLESISTKQGDLEAKFNQLTKEVPNQEPSAEGAGEEFSTWA